MFRKVLAGGFLLIMVGAVIAGAITLFAEADEADACVGSNNREQGSVARQGIDGRGGQGAGRGRGRETREADVLQNGFRESTPQSGYGQGQRLGREQNPGSETLVVDTDRQTIKGVVVETTELIIETPSGEIVQVGLGPSHYRDAQGFALAVGVKVQVSGYWEDKELKASHIINLDTGDSITLRDASGRPMWAGQGRGQGRG
jgi:hypothetical protein